MALRNILKEDDETLRKISKPVNKYDVKLDILIDDMLETLKSADGVGLAAPQVGILKRVVVIDIGTGPLVLVNPAVISQSGEQFRDEGCLSIPDVFGTVKRPKKVVVGAQDRKGKNIQVKGEELLAVVLCHEIDHLDGKLFTDFVIRYV